MGYATGRATGSSANTQDLEIGPQSSGSTLQTLQDVTRTGRSCVTASRRGKPQNSTTSNFISESINEIGKMTDSLGKRGINDTLPPMSSPFDIFEDLVEHALREGFRGALQALAGRRVKFATMCSGTESPILACRLVADACADQGLEFGYEHVFSAEIVPFKQAFIERNFKPPKLFRNITELGRGSKAETAYGASAELPAAGEVHILVAGFACVDFSRLNSQRKELKVSAADLGSSTAETSVGTPTDDDDGPSIPGVDKIRQEGGESSRTFRAIAKYARDFRPAIIILENIKGAPWEHIKSVFEGLGYSARYVLVDTKSYYLPQTRQRGYMICVSHVQKSMLGGMNAEAADAAVEEWAVKMVALQRPASSPVEDFLLPQHSPLLAKALGEALPGHGSRSTIKTANEWAKCLGRHIRYRADQKLGEKTPYTNWAYGKSRMPEYGFVSWGMGLPPRQKDLLDILALTSAADGADFEFKARYLDISQNVDRGLDTAPPGITGCLTPSGEMYSSIHGRPIVGLEALALQGLPIDRLHLTRESQKELQDLAGNAMTTPVVGAAILAAFITALKSIPESTLGSAVPADQATAGPPNVTRSLPLSPKRLKFGPSISIPASNLYMMAQESAKLCYCEDQSSLTSAPLFKCEDCRSTACNKCAGIPIHNFQAYQPHRTQPRTFRDSIAEALPTRLMIILSVEDFEAARDGIKSGQYDWSSWYIFINVIKEALGREVRLQSVRRGRFWTICYTSLRLRLELTFQVPQAQWALYAIPRASASADDPIRVLLREPIARMIPDCTIDDILIGTWQLNLPSLLEATLKVEGHGSLVPSWKAELGLQGFATTKVWSRLHLKFDRNMEDETLASIAGDYELLRTCGTAKRALHVKRDASKALRSTTPNLYLFLDPERFGPSTRDNFVVSRDSGRLYAGEFRTVIARMDRTLSLAPENGSMPPQAQEIRCTKRGSWLTCEASLTLPSDNAPSFHFPSSDLRDNDLAFPDDVPCWETFVTILKSFVVWDGPNPDGRRNGKRCEIIENNQAHMIMDLKWLMFRLQNFSKTSLEWTKMTISSCRRCHVCSLKPPQVKWRASGDEMGKSGSKSRRTVMIPFEDVSEAGPYENATKARPSPFLVRVEAPNSSIQGKREITIAVNFQALAHRALGALLAGLNEDSLDHVEACWRLITRSTDPRESLLPAFTLLSNENDLPRPFDFGVIDPRTGQTQKLRVEQQRSLQWMVRQDCIGADPFEEDVREESLSIHLDLRLEVRVTKRRNNVRGGVIADDVGYGKTVTMLALIKDRMQEAEAEARSDSSRRIPLSATCIITPSTLVEQWADEIDRFWPECNVLSLKSYHSLGRTTIRQFQDAQIVLVSIGLLDKDYYTLRQAELAGLPSHPQFGNLRSWKAWYERSAERLENFTSQLKLHSSPNQFGHVLRNEINNFELDTVEYNIIPSKRLKGDNSMHVGKSVGLGKARKMASKPRDQQGSDAVDGFKEASDLRGVKHPVLGMFRFHRKVVDEQTYVESRQLVAIQSIDSRSTWILSGTPSLRYFADVKRMATFLGVFLGIDDDTEGTMSKESIKVLRKDRTAAEAFQSYKSTRSPSWYEARHQIAQTFLDRFARKNHAEIGEIPVRIIYQPVELDAIHRTIYMELESLLVSEEAKISNKDASGLLSNDRSRRFMDTLMSNSSLRAGLVKLATVMPSGRVYQEDKDKKASGAKVRKMIKAGIAGSADQSGRTRRATSCQAIGAAREADCLRMLVVLRGLLRNIIGDITTCSEEVKERFRKMIRHNAINAHGDPEANEAIDDQFMPYKAQIASVLVTIGVEKSKLKTAENRALDSAKEAETRSSLETLDQLFMAIVSSVRALRYLRRAFELQNAVRVGELFGLDCGCTLMQRSTIDHTSWVNRECGHSSCKVCSERSIVFCPIVGCKARSMSSNVISSAKLFTKSSLVNVHRDAKVEDIGNLVQTTRPEDQVLVFIQFNDIGKAIEEYFVETDISCIHVPKLSSSEAQDQMSNFRKLGHHEVGWKKVLMLDPLDSSAAGHNLTNVHLIIFVSPILTETSDHYHSAYLQAIGRARRQGQTQTVEVYHFVTLNTVDVSLCEEYSGQKLVDRDGKFGLEDRSAVVEFSKDYSSQLYPDLEEIPVGEDAISRER